MGTVVTIDVDKGDVVIRPVGSDKESADIVVKIPANGLPDFVTPGALLRIWGNRTSDPAREFIPQRFSSGDPRMRTNDPTGVRRRLMHDRLRHPPRHRPPGGGHR